MLVKAKSDVHRPVAQSRVFGRDNRTVHLILLGTAFLLVWFTLIAGVLFADDGDNKAKPLQIVAFGDSLTAGYGLGPGEGFTDQLSDWLSARVARPVTVINAGVSGDTTSGGRSRLAWTLSPFGDEGPDLFILELGANDGLRGIDPAITRDNMDAMLADLDKRGIPTLVAGMLAPPNLGPDYAEAFNTVFPELAHQYGDALYPFFLDGVAADPALNQADGIHPTKEGVAIIVSRIGPVILSLIDPGTTEVSGS